MGEIVNPYIAGAPVTEQRMFFGREDIFQWIENSLAGQYADHILVVHGQRRVGKTSVLKQLGNRLPKRYIPVFFDLQGRTHTSLDRFLWWLAREIVRVLKQERGIEIPLPEKEDFAKDLEHFESRFLPDLQPVLGGATLLLTFDEFDNLEESEVKEELARPLVDHLRRMMGTAGLNFIFSIGSSGRKLENMQAAYTEFFKTALYKKISFLSEEQTRNLVTRPVEGVLEYERAAVERIYNIASGHPYFTQLTCHELFARCQRTEQRKIAKSDVEAILDDVVERGTVNLKFVWDEATDIEKWSLTALAQLDKTDIRAVADYLRKNRVRFSETDLTSGLLHLREKDVLTSENRFVIHLLKLWLQKNRPIEQAREELTEVNPIANRYIEIGLEFKDSRVYDKAIESFQEALAISKDNLQAQVNIALTYMDQKLYDKAVAEFEKALAMDDEDVSARSGLCEAHLALGDAAMTRGRAKEATLSYQRVLSFNAEHTEARGRMAELSCQRAEKALVDGKDEEALSAFAEALKFTPEDPALIERVEKVRAEKKAKVLAALLARSEKEAGAKNWEGALKSLAEALTFSPDDASIQKKISEIKAAQEKARLDTLLAKADAAAKSARWDEAIETLTAVISSKPDETIEAKLAEVRAKQREARLGELKTQARSMARAERFDEALSAWGEYLALEPADRENAQLEIEGVKKAQALAKSYAEAQRAFAKKNYDQAVSLLKGIINQDENYKDASRLLAEAIQLRRTARKWWQSRWLWGSVVSSVVVVVAWFVLRPGSPLWRRLSAPTAAPTSASTLNVAPATVAAATAPPTATALPLPYTWARLNSGQFLPRDTITAIVVDPTDPGVIYIGAENAGVFKSIDGGLSWQPSHAGLGRAWVYSLVMDPQDPQTLYAGTLLGGVYKTKDGGGNWALITEGLQTGWEWISIVAIDPSNNQHLYYTQASNIYESVNGGDSWQEIHNMETCPDNIVGLVVHPGNGNIIFSSHYAPPDYKCDPGVYRSEDGGRNWTFISDALPTPITSGTSIWWNFALEQLEGEVLFAYSNEGGLYRSKDQGTTWEPLPSQTCDPFALDPQNGSFAFCTEEGRVYQTLDGGGTWQETVQLDTKQRFRTIVISPHANSMVFLGGSGLWLSSDAGKSFEIRNSGLAAVRFELFLDPSDPSTLVAQATSDGFAVCDFYRSSDGARTWEVGEYQSCHMGFSSPPSTWPVGQNSDSLFAHPTIPGRMYAVYNRPANPPYLYISEDSGQSWHAAVGMSSIADGKLFFDHTQGQRMYAIGDTDAYRSDDAGETWQVCTRTDKWSARSTSRMVVDPRDGDHLILATRGNGILVSKDGCQSWQESNTRLGSLFVNTLAIDPNSPNITYAGTDGGAYISTDGGQTWGQVNDGLLGATVVYSIVVDKDSNVYATTPYGIFKLEGK